MGADTQKTERYDSLDGLRAFSALGIAAMHVAANGGYGVEGFVFEELIPSFTDLVFLFMMISGFSMCCGYYEKILRCEIAPAQFYSKRFAKIWPFFALLTVLDVVISPGVSALHEAFANLTLCFGLLPNAQISVIGVGWTLGVIFVFYLMFPFFCFLLSDRKRAWLSFTAALLMNLSCSVYFFDGAHVVSGFSGRQNILYCGVYFIAGGLLYLYREPLSRLASRLPWLPLMVCAVGIAGYFLAGGMTLILLGTFAAMTVYAIGRKGKKGLLNNKIVGFLSGISMEFYLSHMVIYRVLEKLKLTKLFASGALSFCVTFGLTAVGTVLFAVAAKWCLARVAKLKTRAFSARTN